MNDRNEEEQKTNEDGPANGDGDGGRLHSLRSFSSKHFRVAAATAGAIVVAGALFLTPGDRLLGIDSSSAGIERHHDDDDHGEGDFDRDDSHDRFDQSGPEGEGGGAYPHPPGPPPKLGTSQS